MKEESACGLCCKAFAPNESRHPFGDKTICSACLHLQSEYGNICPACKKILNAEHEEIGLVLSKSDSPHRTLLAEPTAMVICCPHCRVLFFDVFQYEVLRGFREAGARFAMK